MEPQVVPVFLSLLVPPILFLAIVAHALPRERLGQRRRGGRRARQLEELRRRAGEVELGGRGRVEEERAGHPVTLSSVSALCLSFFSTLGASVVSLADAGRR